MCNKHGKELLIMAAMTNNKKQAQALETGQIS